jgi:hypothetical protein
MKRGPKLNVFLGSHEVAEYLGVTRQRFNQLRDRDDFPIPIFQVSATPLWVSCQIDDFIKIWNRKRGPVPR